MKKTTPLLLKYLTKNVAKREERVKQKTGGGTMTSEEAQLIKRLRNENAKKKRLIHFEFRNHFFVYILKKATRIQNAITQFSLAFFLHF